MEAAMFLFRSMSAYFPSSDRLICARDAPFISFSLRDVAKGRLQAVDRQSTFKSTVNVNIRIFYVA